MLSVDAIDLYYGASHTLRRVSLSAGKGEVTCILGRNGVGKTSLLRAICGLQPIRTGRICWEDRPLDGLPPHERARAGLAFVPQGREIFPRLTVMENLATGFAPLQRAERELPDEIVTARCRDLLAHESRDRGWRARDAAPLRDDAVEVGGAGASARDGAVQLER